MSIYIYILLLIIGFIILRILYWFFIELPDNDMISKGIKGEYHVLNTLQNWISENNINAKTYLYNTPKNQIQAIDLLLDSYNFPNVGIEVKYRNVEHITYLKLEHISRYHQDGSRQSTKQLYGYIRQTNRLGLYAFVFVSNEETKLCFLPHYILEKMIRRGNETIYIYEILTHSHCHNWSGNNITFIRYIETEYQNQQQFFETKPKFSILGKIREVITSS